MCYVLCGMRVLPEDAKAAAERCATVVVRTDFTDAVGWAAVLEALRQVPEDWDDEPETYTVDDPSWSGAGVDEVLEAIRHDDHLAGYLSVVMVADSETVSSNEHLLLAVTTAAKAEDPTAGHEFRCLPTEAHAISVNLATGNMDFAEFAETATDSPNGVFRGFPE